MMQPSLQGLQSLGNEENFTHGPGILHLCKSVKVNARVLTAERV